jgi:hypothetical protein
VGVSACVVNVEQRTRRLCCNGSYLIEMFNRPGAAFRSLGCAPLVDRPSSNLAEKKIVHGDMHWDNVLYPYYSDLQHNGDYNTGVDPQLKILIENNNGTQLIKTSRVIKIFDWDLSWDWRLGGMRKDIPS